MSKTIKQIAEELGVSKQAVQKRMSREPLYTSVQPYIYTDGGVKYIEVVGENLIKSAFSKNNRQPSIDKLPTTNTDLSIDKKDLSIDKKDLSIDKKDLSIDKKDLSIDKKDLSIDKKMVIDLLESQIENQKMSLETLKEQIKTKDKQIEQLTKENRKLTSELLSLSSRVGASLEQLTSQNLAQSLIEAHQLQLEDTKSKGFLSRFFRKK